ncbi:MAG: FKBP-type peptidyl-prolyl cis-trans isomerase [Turneriella sp.]|nr:FKBP-type peptidyl-prolyl cis-trans isomerase [Turneriella sp.]
MRVRWLVLALITAALWAKGRVRTASGLEYEILREGKGKAVEAGQRVQVHYTGWLNQQGKKGKKFDSSLDRGRPFVFTLGTGAVIRGWDEGVAGMKVGEKRVLYIPAHLGYGERGAGAAIPPNADLVFEVELLDAQ